MILYAVQETLCLGSITAMMIIVGLNAVAVRILGASSKAVITAHMKAVNGRGDSVLLVAM